MRLYNAAQIREWDQFTIRHEPITSIDLMERAATQCLSWLEQHGFVKVPIHIFCGKGNNGGDGLAIARLLAEKGTAVTVFILEFGNRGTEDFQVNLSRLHQYPAIEIHFIQDPGTFHELAPGSIIIDALLGTGLTRPLEGVTAELVKHMNNSGCQIISIDMPSGLPADRPVKGGPAVEADYTLSFQCYKPAFLVAENANYLGELYILDIGLSDDFTPSVDLPYSLIGEKDIKKIYRKRLRFSHKGHFGHALIIAGSYGKMGAAVLSARACLRAGCGLLTCHIPSSGYGIMQESVPEAMVITDFNSSMVTALNEPFSGYDAIGLGPGIGTARETRDMIKSLLKGIDKPIVVDADGLNCLALDKTLFKSIPPGSLLTPHPREFDRLFGESISDYDRLELATEQAKKTKCHIILKGHHSCIACPSGKSYFNTTGNAGMATAGSGDVLTGILTACIGQGYPPEQAAVLGVYLHGLAGDIAAESGSIEGLIAGDIIASLPLAFKRISRF